MQNVLLIHPIPTPYRTELFNKISQLLLTEDINFFVLFHVLSTRRRSHWKNVTNQFHFNFEISQTFHIESLRVRLPIRPFKEFSKHAPHIIITSGFNMHTLSACLYSKIHNIPIIIWGGEREIAGYGKILRVLLRKLILRYSSHLLTYGKASQIFYREKFNFPPTKMTTLLNVIPVYHNIDVKTRIEEKYASLKRGILKLIYVGDLTEKKGIFFIPPLLGHLYSSHSQYSIEITIIGDGPQRKKFISHLNQYEEKLKIRYMGKISNTQVLNEMASNHILLFPTRADTWGHVITEANSVGTPVLVSRFAGAVPDMIRNGKNGFVVDFSNPSRIVERILKVIDNPEKYYGLCKSSKKSYEDIFSSLKNPETMVGVILNLLESPPLP